ncbi:unnamed protein product [Macrosiphum euphorbiae]|uniref:Uncharacterized protein n=1 Tax=Macrosiphum euphorbiae TaxID=13131 RepID=A0AAV0W933_9HEMI|nr:unnamed protein product [Macrosiphum euphorbiae]
MKFTRSDDWTSYHVSMFGRLQLPIRMMPIEYFTYTKKGKYDCKPAELMAPKNHNPAFFKKPCPNAHSHAFDASTSSFTCRGNAITKYDIIFCPY